jgi:hypothetical protein
MYTDLDTIVLRSGESVTAGVVHCPDTDWADRIETLLLHKGGIWNWQNSTVLRNAVGIDVRFYLLHRDGRPFANIMTAEHDGVGLLGHVWTHPDDRRQGAIKQLMTLQMEDFRARGGRALYLGTDYDSAPYHIYLGFGFEGIEPNSGYMDYYQTSRGAFQEQYYASGPTAIEPLGWRHWPCGAGLMMGDWPGVIRSAPMRGVGRRNSEDRFLPSIRNDDACALALRQTETDAVVGLATWKMDPIWKGHCTVDVYCHPNFWDQGEALYDALSLPQQVSDHRGMDGYVVYTESTCPEKRALFESRGYREWATLKEWVPSTRARTKYLDVIVLYKQLQGAAG